MYIISYLNNFARHFLLWLCANSRLLYIQHCNTESTTPVTDFFPRLSPFPLFLKSNRGQWAWEQRTVKHTDRCASVTIGDTRHGWLWGAMATYTTTKGGADPPMLIYCYCIILRYRPLTRWPFIPRTASCRPS